MLLLILCFKDSTDGEFLYRLGDCSKCAWLRGELCCSIVGVSQGLSAFSVNVSDILTKAVT